MRVVVKASMAGVDQGGPEQRDANGAPVRELGPHRMSCRRRTRSAVIVCIQAGDLAPLEPASSIREVAGLPTRSWRERVDRVIIRSGTGCATDADQRGTAGECRDRDRSCVQKAQCE